MMVRRILAIASQTVRHAVRSRALLSLTLLLLAVLAGIPLLIRGDGTLAGRIQILLDYSLAAAMAILSVVTLWAAAGAVATEIEERPLFLVLSKPVSRMELWVGKWLALVIVNACLLTLVGGIVSAMIFHTVRSAPSGSPGREAVVRDLLTAREALPPDASNWARATDRTGGGQDVDEMTDEEAEPAPPPPPDRAAVLAACTVAPNRSLSLVFTLRDTLQHHPSGLGLSFRFASSRPERVPVRLEWTFAGKHKQPVTIATTNMPGLRHAMPVPREMTDESELTVTVANAGAQIPSTLVFDAMNGDLQLLVPRGYFQGNLVRGLSIALFRLALIAAVGVSAGCLLSTPVAVFVSMFFLILLASSGYVQRVSATHTFYVPHEGSAAPPGAVDRLALKMFDAINAVTAPLLSLDGIPLLSQGRWISGPFVAKSARILLFYTSAVAALGILLFRRREIGRA